MDTFKKNILIFFCTILVLSFNSYSKAEEEEVQVQAIADQIQVLINDIKTLEKAVYQKSDITSGTTIKSNSLNEDILTKHLLKLNELEEQFREITNKFEEVTFKLDKLSTRVTKIQSDNQLRFSDLENSGETLNTTQKVIHDASKPKDFEAKP